MLGNEDELDSFECCPHNDFDCDIECDSCGHGCADHHDYDDDACLMCECKSFIDPTE
jgi:hypothetical protein